VTQVATGAPQAQQFTIGQVLETSFAVLSRNIVPFGVIALGLGLLDVVAQYATGVVASRTMETAVTDTGAEVNWGIQAPATVLGIATFLVSIVIGNLATAAVIYGVFQDLRGQRAGVGDCLSRGFAAILPVVIASVLFMLLVVAASILFIIPGVLVWLAFWLYVPAIVVEKCRIIESLNRSAFLTKGRRWTAAGLWLVVVIASAIVSTVLVKLVMPVAGELGSAVANYIWQAAATAFTAVMTAVSYSALRADKEGVAIDEIAKVFD
jgi:hypothetical protein